MSQRVEVLGIGASFIDHVVQVDDPFLHSIHAKKGSMKSVDYLQLKRIFDRCNSEGSLRAGGSCANTIKGLGQLGHACAFLGRVGQDMEGTAFVKSLKQAHVTSMLIESSTPTGQLACLVTPDGERTFRDYLGANLEFCEEDLKPEFFSGVKLVHIEGFTLFYKNVTQRAMQLAKAAGAKVSFDLSNFELVKRFQGQIIELIAQYVDILFGNQDEIRMLTKQDSEKGCIVLKDICEVVVALMGPEGCWIGHGPELHRCLAYPVVPLDTTGAGDLFSAGFLHGYLLGHSLPECAHYGALTGAAIVQVLGAELPAEQWEELCRKILNPQ